jgi:hypothetical protein
LPIAPQRRLNEPMIAVSQPGPTSGIPAQVSSTDDDTRGVQSVDTREVRTEPEPASGASHAAIGV